MGGASGAAVRLPQIRKLLLAAIVVVLVTVIGIALQRELAVKPPSAAPSFTAGLGNVASAVPLSVEEEAYAAALWPIHSEVKLAAVRMIFAGLHFKTGNGDAGLLKDKVQPLTNAFQSAAGQVRGIQPPESLAEAHESYLQALALYVSASREMVQVADDGRDEHLVAAQQKSERASLAILKLSDVLWPGEYKPN
jgi:hypothetical protein